MTQRDTNTKIFPQGISEYDSTGSRERQRRRFLVACQEKEGGVGDSREQIELTRTRVA